MLVLGLILVLLAAGVVIAVVVSGTDDQAVLYGGNVHVPTLVVFLVGACTLLVLLAGLQLMRVGMRRANRNRKDSKRLRSLEKREEARQEQTGATPGTAPGTGSGTGAEPAGGSGAAPGTETGTTPRTDGPYQTPPPASR
jgi:uncharacterized membrane protein YciS (DUF1049 family)